VYTGLPINFHFSFLSTRRKWMPAVVDLGAFDDIEFQMPLKSGLIMMSRVYLVD
jgi:hypothetical protein